MPSKWSDEEARDACIREWSLPHYRMSAETVGRTLLALRDRIKELEAERGDALEALQGVLFTRRDRSQG